MPPDENDSKHDCDLTPKPHTINVDPLPRNARRPQVSLSLSREREDSGLSTGARQLAFALPTVGYQLALTPGYFSYMSAASQADTDDFSRRRTAVFVLLRGTRAERSSHSHSASRCLIIRHNDLDR
ncbi:hypothetical protein BaRGS_00026182 [Batillaria attramentaria]|uniref:Uncharacterized protein n=1 Tax=Batillaria attramentaria TaxID=370345 RepID=A0ABD0K6W9_9CAEN